MSTFFQNNYYRSRANLLAYCSNRTNNYGWTPFQYALYCKHNESIAQILEKYQKYDNFNNKTTYKTRNFDKQININFQYWINTHYTTIINEKLLNKFINVGNSIDQKNVEEYLIDHYYGK